MGVTHSSNRGSPENPTGNQRDIELESLDSEESGDDQAPHDDDEKNVSHVSRRYEDKEKQSEDGRDAEELSCVSDDADAADRDLDTEDDNTVDDNTVGISASSLRPKPGQNAGINQNQNADANQGSNAAGAGQSGAAAQSDQINEATQAIAIAKYHIARAKEARFLALNNLDEIENTELIYLDALIDLEKAQKNIHYIQHEVDLQRYIDEMYELLHQLRQKQDQLEKGETGELGHYGRKAEVIDARDFQVRYAEFFKTGKIPSQQLQSAGLIISSDLDEGDYKVDAPQQGQLMVIYSFVKDRKGVEHPFMSVMPPVDKSATNFSYRVFAKPGTNFETIPFENLVQKAIQDLATRGIGAFRNKPLKISGHGHDAKFVRAYEVAAEFLNIQMRDCTTGKTGKIDEAEVDVARSNLKRLVKNGAFPDPNNPNEKFLFDDDKEQRLLNDQDPAVKSALEKEFEEVKKQKAIFPSVNALRKKPEVMNRYSHNRSSQSQLQSQPIERSNEEPREQPEAQQQPTQTANSITDATGTTSTATSPSTTATSTATSTTTATSTSTSTQQQTSSQQDSKLSPMTDPLLNNKEVQELLKKLNWMFTLDESGITKKSNEIVSMLADIDECLKSLAKEIDELYSREFDVERISVGMISEIAGKGFEVKGRDDTQTQYSCTLKSLYPLEKLLAARSMLIQSRYAPNGETKEAKDDYLVTKPIAVTVKSHTGLSLQDRAKDSFFENNCKNSKDTYHELHLDKKISEELFQKRLSEYKKLSQIEEGKSQGKTIYYAVGVSDDGQSNNPYILKIQEGRVATVVLANGDDRYFEEDRTVLHRDSLTMFDQGSCSRFTDYALLCFQKLIFESNGDLEKAFDILKDSSHISDAEVANNKLLQLQMSNCWFGQDPTTGKLLEYPDDLKRSVDLEIYEREQRRNEVAKKSTESTSSSVSSSTSSAASTSSSVSTSMSSAASTSSSASTLTSSNASTGNGSDSLVASTGSLPGNSGFSASTGYLQRTASQLEDKREKVADNKDAPASSENGVSLSPRGLRS